MFYSFKKIPNKKILPIHPCLKFKRSTIIYVITLNFFLILVKTIYDEPYSCNQF